MCQSSTVSRRDRRKVDPSSTNASGSHDAAEGGRSARRVMTLTACVGGIHALLSRISSSSQASCTSRCSSRGSLPARWWQRAPSSPTPRSALSPHASSPSTAIRCCFVFSFRMAAMFVFITSAIGRASGILSCPFVWSGYAVGLFLLLSAGFEGWFALVFPLWLLALTGILLVRARRIPPELRFPASVPSPLAPQQPARPWNGPLAQRRPTPVVAQSSPDALS
jgi:hypothetical protein